jgi:acetyltransferase EpsM
MSKHNPTEPLPVMIIGTGPEARLAADILLRNNQVVYGYLLTEAMPGKRPDEINDVPLLGNLADAPYQRMLKAEKMDYYIAEGDAAKRRTLFDELFKLTGRLPLNVIHPLAAVSEHADLAQGNLVCAGAAIAPNAKMEANNIFGAGCVVEADAALGAYCTIGAGARIGARAIIGDGVHVGMGAIVNAGVTVEAGAVVGAGSVVLKTVRAGEVVFGVPAQVMKEGAA